MRVFERAAWVAFLALVPATTLAVAKMPFLPDTNPVVERFSGPQFVVLTLLAGIALTLWAAALMREETRLRLGKVHIAVLAFLAVAILSAALADVKPLAFIGESGRYIGMTTWFAACVALFLAGQLVTNPARLRSMTAAFAITGAVEAVIALSQVVGLDALRFSFPEQYHWMLDQGVGTLGNPNHLASVLVIPLVLSAASIPLASTQAKRVAYAVAAGLMTLSLVASATRAAWIGALVGLALLAVLFLVGGRLSRKRVTISAGAVAVLIVVGVLVSDPAILRTRFEATDPSLPAADQLASGRLEMWQQAVRVIASEPLLGVGSDSLRNAWKARGLSSGKIGVFTDDPHNFALLLLASFGVLGTAAFTVMAALALQAPMKRFPKRRPSDDALLANAWTAALLALLATSLLSVLSIPMVLMLMVALGVASAPYLAPLAEDRTVALPIRASILLGALALTAAGLFASLPPMYHNLQITRVPLDIPLEPEAIAVLDAADKSLPWRYEMMDRRAARLTEQAFYEMSQGTEGADTGRERLESLLSDVDRRQERYPAEYFAWLVRARTYALAAQQLGDSALRAEAASVTNEALRRFPRDLELTEIAEFVQAR